MDITSVLDFRNRLLTYIDACILSRMNSLFNLYVMKTVHKQDAPKFNHMQQADAHVTVIPVILKP